MLVDETSVIDRLRWLEVFPNRPDDHGLDFGSRYPAHRSRARGGALQKSRRQIVTVLDTALTRMARGHPIAAVIEDAASQQSLGSRSHSLMAVDLFVQLGLDRIEQVAIENGGLFARKNLTLNDTSPT